MERPKILLVDDEISIQQMLTEFLESKHCYVQTVGSAEEAQSILATNPPDVALVDVVLPGIDGIDLLGEIKSLDEDCQVVVITSKASLETAVRAIRKGAYDYLQKPFRHLEDVWHAVRRAMEKRVLLRERRHRNQEISEAVERLTALLGTSVPDPGSSSRS